MPPHSLLPPGGDSPFSRGSTFNFTSNLKLHVLHLFQGMNNNNTIRTRPSSSQSAEFNYPVLLVISFQLASTTMVNYILPVKLTVTPGYFFNAFSYFTRLV